MDARRYLREILEPTLKEYANDRTSVRRAFLACVAAYHTLDHLADGKGVESLRKAIRKDCPSFRVIDQVAHAFKHKRVGHPNGELKPLAIEDVISRPPAIFGQMRFDLSRFGDKYGGVTLDNSRNVDLLAELGMVQHYFQQRIAPEDYPMP